MHFFLSSLILRPQVFINQTISSHAKFRLVFVFVIFAALGKYFLYFQRHRFQWNRGFEVIYLRQYHALQKLKEVYQTYTDNSWETEDPIGPQTQRSFLEHYKRQYQLIRKEIDIYESKELNVFQDLVEENMNIYCNFRKETFFEEAEPFLLKVLGYQKEQTETSDQQCFYFKKITDLKSLYYDQERCLLPVLKLLNGQVRALFGQEEYSLKSSIKNCLQKDDFSAIQIASKIEAFRTGIINEEKKRRNSQNPMPTKVRYKVIDVVPPYEYLLLNGRIALIKRLIFEQTGSVKTYHKTLCIGASILEKSESEEEDIHYQINKDLNFKNIAYLEMKERINMDKRNDPPESMLYDELRMYELLNLGKVRNIPEVYDTNFPKIKGKNLVELAEKISKVERPFYLLIEDFQCDLYQYVNFYLEKIDQSLRSQNFIFIAKKMSQTVDDAASAGLILSDIKPDNIVITMNENYEIIECKLTDPGLNYEFKGEGIFIAKNRGTVDYCSPESMTEGQVTDTRIMVYSLAATLVAVRYGINLYIGLEDNASPREIYKYIMLKRHLDDLCRLAKAFDTDPSSQKRVFRPEKLDSTNKKLYDMLHPSFTQRPATDEVRAFFHAF
ncbi:MAG: hypothetical protein Tsb0021_10340 [Chlamydiales bacterium]